MKVSAIQALSTEECTPRRNLFIRYSNSFMSTPEVENPIEKGTNLTTIHLYPKNTQIKVTPPPTLPPTKPKDPLPILPQTGEAKTVIGILGVLVLGTALLLWQKQTKTK